MDWAGIKEVGYGPLNLRPAELGELTLQELKDLLNGYKWREKREWQKLAQLASWTTAPHLKRPISPEKLLKDKKEKKTNKKESLQNVVDLTQKMGIGLDIANGGGV